MDGQPVRWIPRLKDGESFYLHFSGGIRAGRILDDRWAIEPVLSHSRPASFGNFARTDIWKIGHFLGVTPIAFQHAGWNNGSYYSNWIPIVPGQSNHMIGASDLWRNISSRIGDERRGPRLDALKDASHEELAAIIDDQQPDERLAQFIALSLRGMDISVEEIAAFYHEQLVDLMATDRLENDRVSGTLDQVLNTHVHSFFMHAGAARDYLGSFIALKVGEDPGKIDSFKSLCKKLRTRHLDADPMLAELITRGLIKESKQKGQWQTGDWMWDLTELRNTFTHRRPYGSRHAEHSGMAVQLSAAGQFYRYRRPFETNAGEDILDLIVRQYQRVIKLFHCLAEISGLNSDMPVITDDDIIEVRMSNE
ncbi:hypothetical protein HGO38_19560 [Rhizobium sp. CG5]|uniref:hypothetical protein n=1 Tax=Rhizobium sp. CG5 TaxID=2726076 RepID=UPI00203488E2|nr:hypothetical protein [Rhizobium sp. CG5]MCM2475676.1 hypothetical protein [Rhizobium sp. CG5]